MANFYLGQIGIFGFNFAPSGWALCAGQLMSISQNTALFSLLGTTYGGDGQVTFGLPDLRSRTPFGQGNVTVIGEQAGEENVTLTQAQIAAHTHTLIGSSIIADKRPVAAHMFASDTSATDDFYARGHVLVTMNPAAIGVTGGSQPHDNLQPYLTVNYCIALVGVFPSRN